MQFQIFENPELYSFTEWYCMPQGSFELLNEGYVMSTAKSPTLIVGQCSTVGDQLELDTSGCIDDEEILAEELP